MRIFLVCILAVGAIAGDVAKKPTDHKHEKRGYATGEHSFNSYNGHQQQQQQSRGDFGGYEQSGNGYQQQQQQTGFPSSLDSGVGGYSSGPGYADASLPAYQLDQYQQQHQPQQSFSDSLGGQYNQIEQGPLSLDSAQHFGNQQQPAGGAYGYEDSSSLTIPSRVVNHFTKVPVSVPHPVPVERTVKVPVPHPYPVEVRRPVKIAVPSPVAVYVNKPYPVPVNRPVPVPVPQPFEVPHPVPVPVSLPQPIEVPHHDESAHFGSGYEGAIADSSYGQGQNAGQGASFFGNAQQGQQLEHVHIPQQHEHVHIPQQHEHVHIPQQHEHVHIPQQHEHAHIPQQHEHVHIPQHHEHVHIPQHHEHVHIPQQHGHVHVPQQHYNLGGSSRIETAGLANAFQPSYETPVYQQQQYHQHQEQQLPSYESSAAQQNDGYHYDKPAKKFTF